MVNAYKWSPTTSATSDLAAIASRREAREDVASVAQMWVAAAYDDLAREEPERIHTIDAVQAQGDVLRDALAAIEDLLVTRADD